MERLRQVARFWNWLPAFRAVGETEHLPSAAEALGVAPSSLSRAVSQLEKAVGVRLFHRDEGRLRLDVQGARLLDACREAMRTVHEAMLDVQGQDLDGALRLASTGVVTTAFLVPALGELRREHPSLTVQIDSDLTDAIPKLLSGRLDAVFCSVPLAHARLRTERLGEVRSSVFCGAGHPLAARTCLTVDDLAEHAFIAPPPDPDGRPVDGWPAHLPRRVAVHADQMRVGAAVCADGGLLAVLPVPFADEFGPGRLLRLDVEVMPPTPVYAAWRAPAGPRDRIRALIDGVGQRLGRPRSDVAGVDGPAE